MHGREIPVVFPFDGVEPETTAPEPHPRIGRRSPLEGTRRGRLLASIYRHRVMHRRRAEQIAAF